MFWHVVLTAAGSGPHERMRAAEPLELLLDVGVSSLSGACYLSLSVHSRLQIRLLSGRGTQTPRLEHQGFLLTPWSLANLILSKQDKLVKC